MKTAENQKIPAYTVATDKALCDITLKKPTTKEELLKCYGIGSATFEKYGDEILRIVKKHI